MLQSKVQDKPVARCTGLEHRRVPSALNALFLFVILASLSVLVVACGSEPTPTSAPTGTTTQEVIPEPPATAVPAPAPDPVATATPEPTSTPVAVPAPEPTPAAVSTVVQQPTPEPVATATPEPTPTPVVIPTPEPTPEPVATKPAEATPEPAVLNDDELTQAYVTSAIEYYSQNGLDSTIRFYKSGEGLQNKRSLILVDKSEGTLLIFRNIPALEGQYVGVGSSYSGLTQLVEVATEEGRWITTRGINPVTKQEEPRRILVVLHDGLVFSASHSVLVADVGDSVKAYVNKATAKYDSDGLDAVITHYNDQDSLDGQFYLFLIGADDIYLAHPIFPHLIGTDIKDVVGSDGQELGKEIAGASEEGVWVEYLWPHPLSRKEQQKVTWAVRHDGLIFASGYYAGEPETGPPAWRDADPKEYTVQYVDRAVERYETEGLESLLNYYNSVASFEGEWYLFATDDQDIYHIHPLLPSLIGTDIKDVKGSDGYELGGELAKATEQGVWVEYLWPHPVTLKEVPKVSYAVRRDGMLFASGYYLRVEDPAGRTVNYVQEAIDYYRDNGLEATVAHYGGLESFDGQWGLTLADENDTLLTAPLGKHLIGTDLKDLATLRNRQIGEEMAAAGEEGAWISYIFPNVRSSETLYAHTWGIRYDGLLFMSRYYDDKPEVPNAP